jgi:16S rRNA C967 or C1407 C5-methylase (RsmB/RsmF family)
MVQVCECCQEIFTPLPTVKNQRYCRKPACQKVRKRLWQKMKLASDKDYRKSQTDCQKTWREKHPEYWREYRARNSGYTERNRVLQRERNRRRPRKRVDAATSVIAKMDESISRKIISSGRYRLVPVGSRVIAKMDEWIVEIGVVAGPSASSPSSP